MLLRNKPVKWWLNDNKYIKKYDFHIFTVIDSCHYAKCYHTERPPALAVKDKQIWKTRRKIQRHILKSKMAKRNDRNETSETTETTKTKRQQRPKRTRRKEQRIRWNVAENLDVTSDLLSHLRLLNIKAVSRYFIFSHYESSWNYI